MHIVKSKFKSKYGKVYESVLLRESYREGKKVKKRTIANISHCSPEEIEAIRLALHHKADLTALTSCAAITTKQGLSVGAAWVVFQTAKKLGIVDALGHDRNGQLALWQIIARVLSQGSRLSAVRLAQVHSIASIVDLKKGFSEDDLYDNLSWLANNKEHIEDNLFTKRFKKKPTLFLYDVTSSYLEGTENELANWGYNRDGKKGKKQIVIGLLCSEDGTPVASEVFKGNTQDPTTVLHQIKKVQEHFGCEQVTFVGDRGMIKTGQIAQLHKHGFHYVTAITKKQIQTLLNKNIIQYQLFDEQITEIIQDGIRYILRRNPVRAKEISENRHDKQQTIIRYIEAQNIYLRFHSRAQMSTACKRIEEKIKKLKIDSWFSVQTNNRIISPVINNAVLLESTLLDGCYVLKTDLTNATLTGDIIHARYKDLSQVERAFRTCKTHLEIRPVYVRNEANTRGHVLVVFLSYMIVQALDRAWESLYLTVEEGLHSLSMLCLLEVSVEDKCFQKIPIPNGRNQEMLEKLDIKLPLVLPENHSNVVTRKARRKSASKN